MQPYGIDLRNAREHEEELLSLAARTRVLPPRASKRPRTLTWLRRLWLRRRVRAAADVTS